MVKSCNFQLRELGRIRDFLSSDAATSVIHAFITSRLDYANSLLAGLPDTEIKKLQKIQNTAARILTRTRKYDHISHILRNLHWLKVHDRITFKILVLTYKCLHDMAPSYLSELLNWAQPTRSLRSSNKLMLTVPKARPFYGERAFQYIAPVKWNELPYGLKSESTLTSFKTALKSRLLLQQ